MFRGNILQLTKQTGLWKPLCLCCYPIVQFSSRKERIYPSGRMVWKFSLSLISDFTRCTSCLPNLPNGRGHIFYTCIWGLPRVVLDPLSICKWQGPPPHAVCRELSEDALITGLTCTAASCCPRSTWRLSGAVSGRECDHNFLMTWDWTVL